jgi:NADH:ubiquinone oxidoreductase subunit 2 (subunit N)
MTVLMQPFFELRTKTLYLINFLILSFAGMPPFVGFFTKVNVLLIYLNAGNTFLTFLILLISVISMSYYLSIIFGITKKISLPFSVFSPFFETKSIDSFMSIILITKNLFRNNREDLTLVLFFHVFFYLSICFF